MLPEPARGNTRLHVISMCSKWAVLGRNPSFNPDLHVNKCLNKWSADLLPQRNFPLLDLELVEIQYADQTQQ